MRKTKRTLTIAAVLVALAALMTLGILRGSRQVQAQDEVAPPNTVRVSFGTIGITSGQTLRVTVANTNMPNDPNWPPGPIRVVMTLRDMNGILVRDYRTGEVIRKAVDLERGDAAFLDVDYERLPPSPIRAQLRPVVVVTPPPITEAGQEAIPPESAVTTVEVINNSNGRTQFGIYASGGFEKIQPAP